MRDSSRYHTRALFCTRLEQDPDTAEIGSALMAAALDFYGNSDNEMTSVHSTVNRHTKFLDYSVFRNVLREYDFELADLKRGARGVSVYLCFSATRVEISKRWMRIFVNQLLDAMERERAKPAARYWFVSMNSRCWAI